MSEVVFPGDFIANQEEFLAGPGTYAENGEVRAATAGVVEKDLQKREARVKRNKAPLPQMTGLEIIGKVEQVSDKVAFVKIVPTRKEDKRYFVGDESTILKVTNVRRGFVKSLRNEFKTGDIIRAKVIHVDEYTVELSTDGPHLGAVKAFCARCRSPLTKSGTSMICENCEWKDDRKLADDYGEGNK